MFGKGIGTNGFVQVAWRLHGVEQSRQRRELDVPAAGVGLHLRAGARHRPHLDADGRGDPWSKDKPRRRPSVVDVVPQMQVSLSKLQHVLLSVGVQRAAQRARGASSAVPHLFRSGTGSTAACSSSGSKLVTMTMTPMNRMLPLGVRRLDAGARSRGRAARLRRRPSTPPARGADAGRTAISSLFTHSENCVACHNNLTHRVRRGRLDRRRRGVRR